MLPAGLVKFMDADVVLDGGIGGFATTKTAYFLNTKYMHFRPHRDRNMVPLSPNRRVSINQDADVSLHGHIYGYAEALQPPITAGGGAATDIFNVVVYGTS